MIFVSRKGAASTAARELLDELHQSGVKTAVLECDIAVAGSLLPPLRAALRTMPPLRGVIQGAMVLNDGVFANMTHDELFNALQPKVQGSWALHAATVELGAELNFFVMLSSAAATIGNAGAG